MAESVAALHDGSLDVAQLFEPFVEQAVSGGAAVWYPASQRGPTSYTVFVTTRDRLADDPEPFRRMARAMRRTQQWVAREHAAGAGRRDRRLFPDLDRGVLTRSLARYKEQGVWATDPRLSEDGFERLRRALLGSGFLKRAVPFAECVDNRLAEEAVGKAAIETSEMPVAGGISSALRVQTPPSELNSFRTSRIFQECHPSSIISKLEPQPAMGKISGCLGLLLRGGGSDSQKGSACHEQST